MLRSSIGLQRASVRLFLSSSLLSAKARSLGTVPVNLIGTVNDYYIPPALKSAPLAKWPRLILRRMALLLTNTYSVVKLRRDTSIKPKFTAWKDQAVDIYVKTNKAFAKRNLKPVEAIIGKETYKALNKRMETLPSKPITWTLDKLENNPKVVAFLAIPDEDQTAGVCQFCMKLETSQTTTVGLETFKRKLEEYLVFTVNPFNDEVALVGKAFPLNFERGLVDQSFDQTDPQAFMRLTTQFADIFRSL